MSTHVTTKRPQPLRKLLSLVLNAGVPAPRGRPATDGRGWQVAQRAVAVGTCLVNGCASVAQPGPWDARPAGALPAPDAPLLARPHEVRELAPGVISTGREFGATFLPNGRTVLFTRGDPATRRAHLYASEFRDGAWQPAAPLAFSRAEWSDLDPSVSPDGRRLYFVSTRPRPGATGGAVGAADGPRDMDLWSAEAVGRGWGEPTWLAALSSDAKEGAPTTDRHGTLCFFSDRDGPPGRNAIFCAARTPEGLSTPTRLPAAVNAGPSDTSPFLAPDGRTLLFYSTRAGGAGQADLYASLKQGDVWGPAITLGAAVNTVESEYNPVVSRDGATLVFGRAGRLWYVALGALRVPELAGGRFR